MKKLIIEVRANERAMRDGSPHIPWLADELADDAVQCRSAGAAIYHYHPRDARGQQVMALSDYEATIAAIRGRSDILIHPTAIPTGTPEERLSAHLTLARVIGLRPDMAPLDMGTTNMDMWSDDRTIRSERTYENTVSGLRAMAEMLQTGGIKPCLVAWNIPFLRRIGAMLAAGIFAPRPYIHLLVSGDSFLAAHPATINGLKAYLPFLPDADHEWTVMAHGASLEPLLPFILEEGGHISIGLGDYPHRESGSPRNDELVARVAALARSAGREPATPQEARAMLDMG